MVSAAADQRSDQPTLAFDEVTPYVRYGGIDTLLSLQQTRSGQPAETGFLIATQVMELLFTLVKHEWTQARDALSSDVNAIERAESSTPLAEGSSGAAAQRGRSVSAQGEADAGAQGCTDDLPAALAALRRAVRVQDVLVNSWDLLAALTPTEFNAFRDELGQASGFQSYTYRELEFLLGNKFESMIRPHAASSATVARLHRALHEPGLYDAALGLLHRRGLPIPPERVARDWTQPYQPHPEVERAWAEVYADDRPDNELLQLAELLLDTAERVARWRQRHLGAVKRSLGAKSGTGGSSGLEWLRRNAERDVFPELWSLRTSL